MAPGTFLPENNVILIPDATLGSYFVTAGNIQNAVPLTSHRGQNRSMATCNSYEPDDSEKSTNCTQIYDRFERGELHAVNRASGAIVMDESSIKGNLEHESLESHNFRNKSMSGGSNIITGRRGIEENRTVAFLSASDSQPASPDRLDPMGFGSEIHYLYGDDEENDEFVKAYSSSLPKHSPTKWWLTPELRKNRPLSWQMEESFTQQSPLKKHNSRLKSAAFMRGFAAEHENFYANDVCLMKEDDASDTKARSSQPKPAGVYHCSEMLLPQHNTRVQNNLPDKYGSPGQCKFDAGAVEEEPVQNRSECREAYVHRCPFHHCSHVRNDQHVEEEENFLNFSSSSKPQRHTKSPRKQLLSDILLGSRTLRNPSPVSQRLSSPLSRELESQSTPPGALPDSSPPPPPPPSQLDVFDDLKPNTVLLGRGAAAFQSSKRPTPNTANLTINSSSTSQQCPHAKLSNKPTLNTSQQESVKQLSSDLEYNFDSDNRDSEIVHCKLHSKEIFVNEYDSDKLLHKIENPSDTNCEFHATLMDDNYWKIDNFLPSVRPTDILSEKIGPQYDGSQDYIQRNNSTLENLKSEQESLNSLQERLQSNQDTLRSPQKRLLSNQGNFNSTYENTSKTQGGQTTASGTKDDTRGTRINKSSQRDSRRGRQRSNNQPDSKSTSSGETTQLSNQPQEVTDSFRKKAIEYIVQQLSSHSYTCCAGASCTNCASASCTSCASASCTDCSDTSTSSTNYINVSSSSTDSTSTKATSTLLSCACCKYTDCRSTDARSTDNRTIDNRCTESKCPRNKCSDTSTVHRCNTPKFSTGNDVICSNNNSCGCRGHARMDTRNAAVKSSNIINESSNTKQQSDNTTHQSSSTAHHSSDTENQSNDNNKTIGPSSENIATTCHCRNSPGLNRRVGPAPVAGYRQTHNSTDCCTPESSRASNPHIPASSSRTLSSLESSSQAPKTSKQVKEQSKVSNTATLNETMKGEEDLSFCVEDERTRDSKKSTNRISGASAEPVRVNTTPVTVNTTPVMVDTLVSMNTSPKTVDTSIATVNAPSTEVNIQSEPSLQRLYRTVSKLEQTVYAAAKGDKESYMRQLAGKLVTVYCQLQHTQQLALLAGTLPASDRANSTGNRTDPKTQFQLGTLKSQRDIN